MLKDLSGSQAHTHTHSLTHYSTLSSNLSIPCMLHLFICLFVITGASEEGLRWQWGDKTELTDDLVFNNSQINKNCAVMARINGNWDLAAEICDAKMLPFVCSKKNSKIFNLTNIY